MPSKWSSRQAERHRQHREDREVRTEIERKSQHYLCLRRFGWCGAHSDAGRPDQALADGIAGAMQDHDLSGFDFVCFLHLHRFVQGRVERRVLGRDGSHAECFQSGLEGRPGIAQTLKMRNDPGIFGIRICFATFFLSRPHVMACSNICRKSRR